MKAQSLEPTNFESVRWLRFLSRWVLATVLFGIVGLTIYFGGIGFGPSDNALGSRTGTSCKPCVYP